MCGQDSDGNRGAVEETERKSVAQVVGLHRERLVGAVGGCNTMPDELEAYHKKHRPHIKWDHHHHQLPCLLQA